SRNACGNRAPLGSELQSEALSRRHSCLWIAAGALRTCTLTGRTDRLMKPSANPSFDGHEQVVFVNDDAIGLSAIVAIHSTVLGPAAGGCRLKSYASDDDALTDVLRLSRGMTYKNAMADLPLGGGKSVIYRAGADRVAMFEAMGDAIEQIG